MTSDEGVARKLTARGEATRRRIVDAAAELIYEHGVKDTNNEMVRRAAQVSGSQLSHYFPDKEHLVQAVIERRLDSMMGRDRTPPRGALDSIEALQAWADSYVTKPAVLVGGCSFGSLAAEVIKSEPALRADIASGFVRWGDEFRAGLESMRQRGTIPPESDVERLAHALMAAFQGGMLLAQATGSVAPLRDAMNAAIDEVRRLAAGHAPPPEQLRIG
jgi:AcrR family transcriptional regulator